MSLTSYALTKSRAVLASAGTGKTYTLVETYVGLLVGLDGREPLRPSAILALTFTDRAAAQMRQRVLLRVRDIRNPGPVRDAWLASLGGRAKLTNPEELARLEPQVMTAPICTFHSFCGRILGEYAAQCGLPLSPTLLDAPTANQLLAEAALEAVASSMNDGHRDETLTLIDEMGLGNRSGVLAALEEVQKRLGERGLSVEEMELCERPACGAFSAAVQDAAAALRALADVPAKTDTHRRRREEILTAVEVLETADDVDALLPALRDAIRAVRPNWGGKDLTGMRHHARDSVQLAAGAWAREQALRVGQLFKGLLMRAAKAYERRKHEMGALDFNDMLVGARNLLRNHPAVRRKLQERYGAVLVDEMQDTSPIQAELLMLLMDGMPIPPESLQDATIPPGRLLLVGDRKQSIYGFRGADVSLFEDARAALNRSGGEELVLRDSRRSTERLVQLLNHLSSAALGVGFTPDDALRAVKEGGLDVPGTWLRVTMPKDAQREDRRRLEAMALGQHIRKLVEEGTAPADIVVLLRARTNAEVYRSAIESAGVPARMGRGGNLLARPEVQDALALLTLVADPTNTHALATVLRCPLMALRDEALVALSLVQSAGKLDGLRVLGQPLLEETTALLWPQEVEALQRLKGAVLPMVQLGAAMDAGEALWQLWDALDGWAAVELYDDGPARAANIRALELLVRGRSVPDAVRFLREAERAGIDWPLGLPEGVVNQVTILTIHEAKGLEYKVVALADLCGGVRGQFSPVLWHPDGGLAVRCADHVSGVLDECDPETPLDHVAGLLAQDSAEESDRLLYVALTRAEERLIFSGEPEEGKDPRNGSFGQKLFAPLQAAVGLGLVEEVQCEPRLPLTPVPEPTVPMDVERGGAITFSSSGTLSSVDAELLANALVCARRYALMHLEPFQREPYLLDADAENPVLTAQMRELLATAVWLSPLRPGDAVTSTHLDGALRSAGMDAAQLPDASAQALREELRAVWESPLHNALRQVPLDKVWTELPALVVVDGTSITGRIPYVVEGTQGEPWMLVDVVREADTRAHANHLARLQLFAVMVARSTQVDAIRAVLCYAQRPPARFFVHTWTSADLQRFQQELSAVLPELPTIRKRPLPEVLERSECLERGCGFVNICHGK